MSKKTKIVWTELINKTNDAKFCDITEGRIPFANGKLISTTFYNWAINSQIFLELCLSQGFDINNKEQPYYADTYCSFYVELIEEHDPTNAYMDCLTDIERDDLYALLTHE